MTTIKATNLVIGETYTRHTTCPALCEAEKLFTRPAPPPADHIGEATTMGAERAALCYRLKEMAKAMTSYGYAGCTELCIEAADMLAADAQWETESVLIDGIAYTIPSPVAYELLDLHLKLQASDPAQPDNPNKEVDLLHKLGNRLSELLDEDQFSECEDMLLALEAGPWTLKRAQQVAVHQVDAVGAALDLEARAKTVESKTTERAMLHAANCLRMLASAPRPPKQIEVPQEPNNDEVICPNCSTQFRAIPVNVQRLLLNSGFNPPFTDVPQPPQADAQAADHVRAMVPMTEQELDDLLPTNDSMSRKDSQRWIARAVERRNGIMVK